MRIAWMNFGVCVEMVLGSRWSGLHAVAIHHFSLDSICAGHVHHALLKKIIQKWKLLTKNVLLQCPCGLSIPTIKIKILRVASWYFLATQLGMLRISRFKSLHKSKYTDTNCAVQETQIPIWPRFVSFHCNFIWYKTMSMYSFVRFAETMYIEFWLYARAIQFHNFYILFASAYRALMCIRSAVWCRGQNDLMCAGRKCLLGRQWNGIRLLQSSYSFEMTCWRFIDILCFFFCTFNESICWIFVCFAFYCLHELVLSNKRKRKKIRWAYVQNEGFRCFFFADGQLDNLRSFRINIHYTWAVSSILGQSNNWTSRLL